MTRGASLLVVLMLAACGAVGGGPTFTLYRSSIVEATGRIHVATFDASERGSYNQENCEIARGLFQQQRGVATHYWCEPGRFRP